MNISKQDKVDLLIKFKDFSYDEEFELKYINLLVTL